MINLKLFCRTLLIILPFTPAMLLTSTPSALAFNLTGAIGSYLPSDQLVRQLYGSSVTGSVQMGFSHYQTFDWTITTTIQKFQNENSGVKSDTTMTSLLMGFEKRFPAAESDQTYIEPFMGAGVSLVHLSDNLNYNTQDSNQEDSYVYGLYWEVGLLIPAFSTDSRFVLDWKQSNIARMVYGDINLGGTLFSVGYRVGF